MSDDELMRNKQFATFGGISIVLAGTFVTARNICPRNTQYCTSQPNKDGNSPAQWLCKRTGAIKPIHTR